MPTGLDPDLNEAMRKCVRAALEPASQARWGVRGAPRLRVPQRRDRLRHLAGRRHRVRRARPHPRGGLRRVDRSGRGRNAIADGCPMPRSPAPRPSRPTCSRRSTAYERAILANDLDALDAVVRARRRHDARRCAPACSSGTTRSARSAALRGGVAPRAIERIEYRPLAPTMSRCSSSVSRFVGRGHGPADAGLGARRRPLAHHRRPRHPARAAASTGRCGGRSATRSGRARGRGRWPDSRSRSRTCSRSRGTASAPATRPSSTRHAPRPRHAPAVTDLLRGGASLRGIARTDEFAYSIAGDNVALRHPAQRRTARGAAGRLVERPGIGRRDGPGRDRPRHRHGRLGPRPRVLPGTLGSAHDARTRAPAGPAAARAVVRHGRLAHPRRRDAAAGRRLVPELRQLRSRPRTSTASRMTTCPWRFVVPAEVLDSVEPETRAAFDAFLERLAVVDGCRRPSIASRSAISTSTSCRSAPCRARRRGATTANGSPRTRMRSAPPSRAVRVAASDDHRR